MKKQNFSGKHMVVAIIFFLLLIGIAPGQETHLVCLPSSPYAGQKYFKARGCIQCHAVYGQGGDEAPDLGEKKFYGTYFQLAALFWNHFPKMYKKMESSGYEYQKMSTDEMKALVGYLAFIRYMGEKGNVWTGRKLLHSMGCFSCHKFGGEGGDIGPDISALKEQITPIFLAQTLWNHGPSMMGVFEKHNIRRPKFSGNEILHLSYGIMSFMNPTRVPAQASFMGDPMKGAKLAAEKGCMLCHAFKGKGGDIGPDFEDIDLNLSVTEIAGHMWNHGPKMWEAMKENNIRIPKFKGNEMADILAYVYALKLIDEPGDKAAGEELIRSRNCLSCHTLEGKGTGKAMDLSTVAPMTSPFNIISAMWNHAPDMHKKYSAIKNDWPEFTARDIANVYAFFSGNHESRAD